MQTYSGRKFWPVDPRPEEIFIEDIAHALSLTCRYGGHCERFYSVAEHCVLVSQVVPPEMALMGLLHDATETYCADIIRPLKPYLAGYKDVEDALWTAIAERFDLEYEMPPCVKEADNALLLAEQAQIMKLPPAAWSVPGEAAAVIIECWAPEVAEAKFIERFVELRLGNGA